MSQKKTKMNKEEKPKKLRKTFYQIYDNESYKNTDKIINLAKTAIKEKFGNGYRFYSCAIIHREVITEGKKQYLYYAYNFEAKKI